MRGAIEFNGDVYSCDHFVFPEYYLGNIRDKSLVEMMWSDRQLAFGAAKRTSLPPNAVVASIFSPVTANVRETVSLLTPTATPGLNYLCEGYRMFF